MSEFVLNAVFLSLCEFLNLNLRTPDFDKVVSLMYGKSVVVSAIQLGIIG